MKLIDLHKEWCKRGTIGKPMDYDGGLCNMLPYNYYKNLEEFRMNSYDISVCTKEKIDKIFWASGLKKGTPYKKIAYDYTPLRQTIVLLICAMNNEL